MNRNLFAQIILPIREAYYYYYSPEKTDGKIGWVHCTGDTAQAFGIIDPATRGYALFPSPALRKEINELIRLYQKIDHVEIKAQIHAVLFTARGILRWYEIEHNPRHLEFAEDLYRRYRQLAMTEDYENYNWFGGLDGGVRDCGFVHRSGTPMALDRQGRVSRGCATHPIQRLTGESEGWRFRLQQLRRAG